MTQVSAMAHGPSDEFYYHVLTISANLKENETCTIFYQLVEESRTNLT